MRADTAALREAYRVFTNSRVVAERLQRFNGVSGQVLYPPVLNPGLFRSEEHGDEIVSVCRFVHHKRQHLLIEAMRHTRTPVRLRLCGQGMGPAYAGSLHAMVAKHGLQEKVHIDERWVTEEEKADVLATALASAYAPYDKDPSTAIRRSRRPMQSAAP